MAGSRLDDPREIGIEFPPVAVGLMGSQFGFAHNLIWRSLVVACFFSIMQHVFACLSCHC